MNNKIHENIEKYEKHYNKRKMFDKIKSVFKKAGIKTIYMVLLLYYTLNSPEISKTEKIKIYGALGYFILPTDVISDFIPITGYTDDATILLWTLYSVWKNITPEIKKRTKDKLKEWFDKYEDKEDITFFKK